jgi:hypothetical protein
MLRGVSSWMEDGQFSSVKVIGIGGEILERNLRKRRLAASTRAELHS